MYGTHSSRSSSSVEILNPLVEAPAKFNIIPNSSHPHLPRTRSEPVSNMEKLATPELVKDFKAEQLGLSNISKISLEGDCNFS